MSHKNLVSLQSLHVLAKVKTIKIIGVVDFLAIPSSKTPLSCTDRVLIFCIYVIWVLINVFQLSKLVWVIPVLW